VVSKNGEVICAARETGLIYWIRDLNAGRKFKKTGGLMGLGGKRVIKPGWSSPLLVNNRVLVAGSTGELYAINAKTGAVERTVKLGDPTLIGPIAMGGMVYVVTDKAELIALR
jgi:outer membrane protein assembly factor BamB